MERDVKGDAVAVRDLQRLARGEHAASLRAHDQKRMEAARRVTHRDWLGDCGQTGK